MGPVRPNGVKGAEVSPWSFVLRADFSFNIGVIELLSIYRIRGYSECPYNARCKTGSCRRNPHCLWGLGDKNWVDFKVESVEDDKSNPNRTKGQIVGIHNLGATCYVNSLLQLWFHNPIICRAILKWAPFVGNPDDYAPTCAVGQLQAIFARMKISKQKSIDPRPFAQSLQLDLGVQQDAQEFSKLLLDCLTHLLDSSPPPPSANNNSSSNNPSAINSSSSSPINPSSTNNPPSSNKPSSSDDNSSSSEANSSSKIPSSNKSSNVNSSSSSSSKIPTLKKSSNVNSSSSSKIPSSNEYSSSNINSSAVKSALNESSSSSLSSTLKSTFRGESVYVTRCHSCGSESSPRLEEFKELQLTVRKTLGESLAEFCLKGEVLEGDNKYFCSSCGTKEDATRAMRIVKLPPVLNIQLMRFVYDVATNDRKKVSKKIEFPEILDMSKYVDEDYKKTESLVYHLNAVLIHNGTKASSGHYIAHIKDIETGSWFECNDVDVEQIKQKGSKTLVVKDEDETPNETSEETAISTNVKSEPTNGESNRVKIGKISSNGAYMLVYTKEKYFKPDCDELCEFELPLHLQKLVEREDSVAETEFLKNKIRLSEEEAVRNLKLETIKLLYGPKYPPKVEEEEKSQDTGQSTTDDEESSAKNSESGSQQPSTAPKNSTIKNNSVRTQNVSNNSAKTNDVKNNSVSNSDLKNNSQKVRNNSGSKSNISNNGNFKNNSSGSRTNSGVKNNSSAKNNVVKNNNGEVENVEIDVENVDFLETKWLMKWLKEGDFNVPPLSNSGIMCEHGRLRPPKKNDPFVPYKIIPTTVARVLYDTFGGEHSPELIHLHGLEALCSECVVKHSTVLRAIQQLEIDAKAVVEDARNIEEEIKKGNGKGNYGGDKVWIGKETFRRWKGAARVGIESRDIPIDEECREVSDEFVFNEDILCPHGKLSTDGSNRRLISILLYSLLTDRYFPSEKNNCFGAESPECGECLRIDKENSRFLDENKITAQREKQGLSNLFHGKSRPLLTAPGNYYILPTSFIEQWRNFIRNPLNMESPPYIPIEELLCSNLECGCRAKNRGGFKYPLHVVLNVLNFDPEEANIITLVSEGEMKVLRMGRTYSTDPVTVRILDTTDSSSRYQTNSHICHQSADQWCREVHEKVFKYENGTLFVKKIESEILDDAQFNEESEEGPGKHPKERKLNPDVRRSSRTRVRPHEKGVFKKISSSMTIRDFMINYLYKFYNSMISDMHIYHNNRELSKDELSQSLRQLRIPSNSTLLVKIDEPNSKEEQMDCDRSEGGFSGTALLFSSYVPQHAPNNLQSIPENESSSKNLAQDDENFSQNFSVEEDEMVVENINSPTES